jgi:hypothetical protein
LDAPTYAGKLAEAATRGKGASALVRAVAKLKFELQLGNAFPSGFPDRDAEGCAAQ